MGKVFVKGPVESPDDLLEKGKAGQLGRFAGRAGLATVGGIAGALMPAKSFKEWLMNMITSGKIAASMINSKSSLDALKDQYREQDKARDAVAQEREEGRVADEKASDMSDLQNLAPEGSTDGAPSRNVQVLPKRGILPFTGKRNRYNEIMDQNKETYEQVMGAGRLPRQEQLANAKTAANQAKQEELVANENIRHGIRGTKGYTKEGKKMTSAEILAASQDDYDDYDDDVAPRDPMKEITQQGSTLRQESADNMPNQPELMHPDAYAEIKEAGDELLEETTPVPDKVAIEASGALSDEQNDGKTQVNQVENFALTQNQELGGNDDPEIQGVDEKATPSLEGAGKQPMAPVPPPIVEPQVGSPFGRGNNDSSSNEGSGYIGPDARRNLQIKEGW